MDDPSANVTLSDVFGPAGDPSNDLNVVGTFAWATQSDATLTLGPPVLGWSLSLLLAGVCFAWAGIYWTTFARPDSQQRDSVLTRMVVLSLVILQCINSALSLWAIWYHSVDQDRSDEAISSVILPDALGSTICALVAVIVQGYFLQRVYRFIRSSHRALALLVAALIATLAVAGFAGGLGVTVSELRDRGDDGSYDDLLVLTLLWTCASAATDIAISASMVAVLLRTRLDNNRIRERDWLLNRLMRGCMETASLTTVAAVAGGIVYALTYSLTCVPLVRASSDPRSNLAQALTGLLPPLYTMSALYSLNSRHKIRRDMQTKSVVSLDSNRHGSLVRGDDLSSASHRQALRGTGQLISFPAASASKEERNAALYRTPSTDSRNGAR